MTMRNKTRGFTIIELNLAMIFVTLLLIATVSVTLFAGRMYQTGITYKTINQTGRSMVEQMRRDIAQSSSADFLEVGSPDTVNVRICLDSVSYIINMAAEFHDVSPSLVKDSTGKNVYIAKVDDTSKLYCNPAAPPNVVGVGYQELLASGNDTIPVAVHSLNLTEVAWADDSGTSERQRIYQLSFVLGTNEKDTTLNGSCKPPSDNQANFNLCSVREFSTMLRTREGL